jgi:hypothetical protein
LEIIQWKLVPTDLKLAICGWTSCRMDQCDQ